MSVTGGVKFFKRNFALFKDGANANASSNDDGAVLMLSPLKYAKWISVGSTDLTEETITITLPSTKTINRIVLAGINLKEFDVQYNDGIDYLDFTNIIGVNGEETASINETDFQYDSAYYEFDSVETNTIRIRARKTKVVDDQKIISTFFAMTEIGTLTGYPKVTSSVSNNEKTSKSLSQRAVIQKTYETSKFKLTYKNHPVQNDIDIMNSLFESLDSFLIFLCGGRTGNEYFKISQKNWDLDDIFNVQNKGRFKTDFEKNIYTAGVNTSVLFEESI